MDQIINNSKEYFHKKFIVKLTTEPSKNSYAWLFLNRGIQRNEILKLIAIFLYMGMEPKKSIRNYWSSDILHSNNFIPTIMSKNMFGFLCSALHLEMDDGDLDPDNENEENENENQTDINNRNENLKNQENDIDPRIKMLSFIEKICQKFKTYFYPHKNICIDESLVYFRGRCKIKFYMPLKPHKWGFKLHLICDSKTNYVLDILFDPGKDYKDLIILPEYSYTESIVIRLCRDYSHKNHILFFDSWYSGFRIMDILHEMGIDATSILKNTITNFIPSENYNVYTIVDRKKLNFISTIHNDEYNQNSKNKPEIQYEYLKNAKSIDLVNQYSAFHGFKNRSKKWWKRIFFFMIDIIISNSIILKENLTNKKVDKKSFVENLIMLLIKKNEEDVQMEIEVQNKTTIIPKKFFKLLHDIEKAYKSGRCKECQRNCTYKCVECEKFLHPECFKSYHIKNVYDKNFNN